MKTLILVMTGLDPVTQGDTGKLEFMALDGRKFTFIVSDKRLLKSGQDGE